MRHNTIDPTPSKKNMYNTACENEISETYDGGIHSASRGTLPKEARNPALHDFIQRSTYRNDLDSAT